MKYQNGTISLSTDHAKNIRTLNNTEYQILRLHPDKEGSKGGNSFVFTLRNISDLNERDNAIKICREPLSKESVFSVKRRKRFLREIGALEKAKSKNYIVDFLFKGKIEVSGNEFYYYVMEKAEKDLKDFILQDNPDIQTKVQICKQIILSLIELHELEIYHRDIKPDNFLYIDSIMKIGDLGLMKYRQEDDSIDASNELIGPRGWLSPESMNKFLTESTNYHKCFDCKIDYQSDIFQLGKLFWFIFQGNVPIGGIKRKDFLIENDDIYQNIIWMLNHSKKRRPLNINHLFKEFGYIFRKFAI